MEQMKKMPLEGIRVVELATVVAAPTASRVLCAFGAEVIKVETKIGDEMRRAGEFLHPSTKKAAPKDRLFFTLSADQK